MLEGALAALVAQHDPPPYEIIVVDNNSTDHTRQVIERYAAAHPQVRCVCEATPGLSHARNTGVRHATGALVAFTDDDVRVPPDWVRVVGETSERYPDAACFGGPVFPEWPSPPPAWLTEDLWSALGAQTYGADAFAADETRPVCLIGANLVFRRSALDVIGSFATAVQRVGNGIGSTEDHEYHRRLWATGGHGIYEPRLRAATVLAAERLSKRYHRRWHFGHGRHIARMRLDDMERSRASVFGVPAHLLRQAVIDALSVARAYFTRHPFRAFAHELRIWFAAGFVRERWGRALMRPGDPAGLRL
jgi:glycosyltransferase involved in cell wall biosynthesis